MTPPDARDQAGDERDGVADQRDRVADRRDRAGDERDDALAGRDRSGTARDGAGGVRDDAWTERDLVGDQRDEAAEQRDRAAEAFEARYPTTPWALDRSAIARSDAAADRHDAAEDRRAGAGARTEAELDRAAALADRQAGAVERAEAELDRSSAHADRDASAQDREDASFDSLTGVMRRGDGFLALDREVARAHREIGRLTVGFVDVDHLKATNDTEGHDAGDRVLIAVGGALRANLRAYDLVFRYGGDEFVCALFGLGLADATRRMASVNVALAGPGEPRSVSIGLAELRPEDSPDDLVGRADDELYRSRERRRGARG